MAGFQHWRIYYSHLPFYKVFPLHHTGQQLCRQHYIKKSFLPSEYRPNDNFPCQWFLHMEKNDFVSEVKAHPHYVAHL
jgi:hypothetical protein